MTAPQTAISASYAACASTTFERRRVRRPPRQAVAPRHLAAWRAALLTVLRRPERRRAGPHVDVRGERAVDHRRARAGRSGRARPGTAPRRSAGRSRRRATPGVIAPASVNGVATTGWPPVAISIRPVAHRAVEPQRRVRVDDRHAASARATSASRSTPRTIAATSSASSTTVRAERRGTATSCRASSRTSGTCRGGASRPAGRSARAGRRPPGG